MEGVGRVDCFAILSDWFAFKALGMDGRARHHRAGTCIWC